MSDETPQPPKGVHVTIPKGSLNLPLPKDYRWKGLRPGAVMVRGREVMVLNYANQWMAPGVSVPMPVEPDGSWTMLRAGFDDE